MKRFRAILKQFFFFWFPSILISAIIVHFFSPIAAGLMTLPVVDCFSSPEAKIIAGFVSGLVAFWIALNLAEIAVFFTSFRIANLIRRWKVKYQERMQE